MSDLQKFCRDILAQIEISQDETEPNWFSQEFGLCFNSLRYDRKFLTSVEIELKHLFAGDEFPFNVGVYDYDVECEKRTVYKNKKRLAFLREHAKL